MNFRLVAASLLIVKSANAASPVNGAWCSEDAGEMYVNADSVEFIDFSCPIESRKDEGERSTIVMSCTGDSGSYRQTMKLSRIGSILIRNTDTRTSLFSVCRADQVK